MKSIVSKTLLFTLLLLPLVLSTHAQDAADPFTPQDPAKDEVELVISTNPPPSVVDMDLILKNTEEMTRRAIEDAKKLPILIMPQPVPSSPSLTPGSATIEFKGSFNSDKTNDVKKVEKLIYKSESTTTVKITNQGVTTSTEYKAERAQGELKQLELVLHDFGRIESVKGDNLRFWGIRSDKYGIQSLILQLKEGSYTNDVQKIQIDSVRHEGEVPYWFEMPSLLDPESLAFDGEVKISKPTTLVMKVDYKQKGRNPMTYNATTTGLTYRIKDAPLDYRIHVETIDPNLRRVLLSDLNLDGKIDGNNASFTLKAKASIKHSNGGSIELFKGSVSVTDFKGPEGSMLGFHKGSYWLYLSKAGTFPITVLFDSPITTEGTLNRIQFEVPPAPLRPVKVTGLPAGIGITLVNAAGTSFRNQVYEGNLPPTGGFNLSWRELKKAEAGSLFFSVNSVEEMVISPGLLRQESLLTYQIMQGSLREFSILIDNQGEVTQLFGSHLLSWTIENIPDSSQSRLKVKLNQSVGGSYPLKIFTQKSLGAFPSRIDPVRFTPEKAIRFGGHTRIKSAGAVRIDVLESPGLTQVSHDRFPTVKELNAAPSESRAMTQLYSYQFSGPARDLVLQADNILPEVGVSEILIYHMGETERRIQAEFELDIREAPLRELEVAIPSGYGVLSIEVPNLSDHTVATEDGNTTLHLQFASPLNGRQLMRILLSANQTEPPANWSLPVIDIPQAATVQGHIGISADLGLRLKANEANGLSEVAAAFFPQQNANLQLTYRIRERNWSIEATVEREAQSIQADTLQLFSAGEGIVYGSTLVNYLIAGAPVSTLWIKPPDNAINVEFTGRDIRGWKQHPAGYEVTLHRPVSGAYSLLVTWQTQFEPQGAELDFSGMAPTNIQSEQGYIIVVSPNPFQHETVTASKGLIPIETGEIPAEYRLLFDAPILSSHQFTSRPFELKQRLTLLPHGESISQVIDRASYETRISSVGQTFTKVRYLVKSKGEGHFRLTKPEGHEFWSIKVQDKTVVSVKDGDTTLIPLPKNLSPDTIVPVDIEIINKGETPANTRLELPQVESPVLFSNWRISPDPGHRIEFKDGTIAPETLPSDVSGFAWLSKLMNGRQGRAFREVAWLGFVALCLGSIILRWATSRSKKRFEGGNLFGLAVGGIAVLAAIGVSLLLAGQAFSTPLAQTIELNLNLPYQDPGALIRMDVASLELGQGIGLLGAWPILLGAAVWLFALVKDQGMRRTCLMILGWIIAVWGGLKTDQGAPLFFAIVAAFIMIHVLIPFLMRQYRLSPRTPPASTAAILLGLVAIGVPGISTEAAAASGRPQAEFVQSIHQKAEAHSMSIRSEARIVWNAKINEELTLLSSPAVPFYIRFPEDKLELYEEISKNNTSHKVAAKEAGSFTIEIGYDVPLSIEANRTRSFIMPLPIALTHHLEITTMVADVQMVSRSTAAIHQEWIEKTNQKPRHQRFKTTILPVEKPSISFVPITRDVSAEETRFHADLSLLFIPNAGAIEGRHQTRLRVTQGVLKDLELSTPDGLSITDIQAKNLSTWRFDPEEKKARLQFEPPLTGENIITIRSQVTTGNLPYEQETGIIGVSDAVSEIGKVGVATGPEIELDRLGVESLTRINIEDFDQTFLKGAAGEFEGLRLRRALRYQSSDSVKLTIKASIVEPDIRIVENNTLSIGEDRMVLSTRLGIQIQRAGIFKLTFPMPADLDIESISGSHLSHWTDLDVDGVRTITLHLKGKTQGATEIAATLSGQGLADGASLTVPRIKINESDKQTGQVIIYPEQGMQLEMTRRDGTTQMDPRLSGINNKDVLAFRLLQKDWQLEATITKVEPWIQAALLQDLSIREGMIKATVQMQFKIENAGIKSLTLRIPDEAEAVRIECPHLSDFVKTEGSTNGWTEWEVTLQRRIIGTHPLKLLYQIPSDGSLQRVALKSVQGSGVNLQRNFLSLRADGRIQLSAPASTPELQDTDWEAIPQEVRRALGGTEGSHVYSVARHPFTLPVELIRHETADQLPAQVRNTRIHTVLTDSGVMLTQATIELDPGDKRHLKVTLPKGGIFWFASVNSVSARPWKEGDDLLIPLEKPLEAGQPTLVSFTYSTPDTGRRLPKGFRLVGPAFDLPLQDIRWTIQLPEGRRVRELSDAWQYEQQLIAQEEQVMEIDSYLMRQKSAQQEKTKKAESLLNFGNNLLQEGDQQRARKAFNSAYNLSQHDDAFNEDARVQLQNLKKQQALVGLVNRRGNAFMEQQGQQAEGGVQLQLKTDINGPKYSEREFKQVLANNAPEVNGALVQLAEQLINQQEATLTVPEGIHAELPIHREQHVFTRSIMIDDGAVALEIETETEKLSGAGMRVGLMINLAILFAALAFVSHPGRAREE